VIDPACSDDREKKILLDYIKDNDLKPEMGNGLKDPEWRIRDNFGRIIYQGFIISAGDLIINADHISSGSYFIEIWMGNQFLGIQKFIILPN